MVNLVVKDLEVTSASQPAKHLVNQSNYSIKYQMNWELYAIYFSDFLPFFCLVCEHGNSFSAFKLFE